MHTYSYIYTHAHIYLHTHAYTHTHVCTHIYKHKYPELSRNCSDGRNMLRNTDVRAMFTLEGTKNLMEEGC